MQAFHNDPKIKEKYLNRVLAHYKADEIIQGKYWEKGKGCAVGCTIESSENPHQRFEEELGIPRIIARVEDRIFEGLSNGDAKKFPVKFLQAVNVGADLSKVMPKFFIWLLADPKDGVIKYARADGKVAIERVVDLYKQILKGKKVSNQSWRADAADATATAYAAAATAYAYAAAATTAYAADAADATAYAAATATTAYADAATAAAAYAAAAATTDAAATTAYDAADAATTAYAAATTAYAYAAAATTAYAYAAATAYADATTATATAYADATTATATAYAYAAAAYARTLFYKKMAKKLLQLLKEAK